MAILNNIFTKTTKTQKSTEEIMRERLSHELGNSGLIGGIMWCGIVSAWAFLFLLDGETASVKIISGIIFALHLALIIYLAIRYLRQKNAMEGILEAFLAGERNISNIALSVNVDNKTVSKLIQTMIFKRIIIDAHIDKTNNRIIDTQKTADSSKNAGKIVICSGCGAKNTLTGILGQTCEYCGTAIRAEMIDENDNHKQNG